LGAPRSADLTPFEVIQRAGALAVREAVQLEKAGFEGVILENFGDIPFSKKVGPETIAAMTVLAAAVVESVRIPVGINILRNDALAALAVASAAGAQFIRVNVLSGVAATDQGFIEGEAALLVRERARLASPVEILADVHVKHAKSLSSDSLETAIEEVIERGLADGVIVTGSGTGKPTSRADIELGVRVAKRLGVTCFVGSGVTRESAGATRGVGAGVIVGSDLRENGKAGAKLEEARLKSFVTAWNGRQQGSGRGQKDKKK